MDRRTLLRLGACLPVLAHAPANACSIAPRLARFSEQQKEAVLVLFQVWWKRDAIKFRAYFPDQSLVNGTAAAPVAAIGAGPIQRTPLRSIFDRFFTDERKVKRITFILNTDAGLIVGCSEANRSRDIGPDCRGMPTLHVFLVTMSGLTPQTMTHWTSTQSLTPDWFNVWSEKPAQ